MKAIIPDKIEEIILYKIYLDLEIHVLRQKVKFEANSVDYKKRLKRKIEDRRQLRKLLQKHSIIIEEPINDGIAVQYNYRFQLDGGYKTGSRRIWKAALKMNLNNRMNEKK